ncbi:phage integrase N-terminal SAM-like domain-containing protein [Chloroflexi bacterium TSY]|nr:phage integrase N-terminal SAM-like domain-containing protein [Chloroflexi bacterium TSY]
MTQPPKLLDQVRHVLRAKHYSIRTEEAYLHWIRRFRAEFIGKLEASGNFARSFFLFLNR